MQHYYPAHQRYDSRMQPCDGDLSSALHKSPDAQRERACDRAQIVQTMKRLRDTMMIRQVVCISGPLIKLLATKPTATLRRSGKRESTRKRKFRPSCSRDGRREGNAFNHIWTFHSQPAALSFHGIWRSCLSGLAHRFDDFIQRDARRWFDVYHIAQR